MSVRSRSHGAHEALSRGRRLFDATIWKLSEPRPHAVTGETPTYWTCGRTRLSGRVLLDGVSDPADREQHRIRIHPQADAGFIESVVAVVQALAPDLAPVVRASELADDPIINFAQLIVKVDPAGRPKPPG